MPLSCPMLDNKKHKTHSHALYHLINFEFVESFRQDAETETIVLIDILTDSLNYGAQHRHLRSAVASPRPTAARRR